MSKEEYLSKLRSLLEEGNVSDIDKILEAYEKRYQIGLDAGLSDSEIYEMLLDPEVAAEKYLKDKDEFVYYDLELDEVFADDIHITSSPRKGIDINVDEELRDKITISTDNHQIKIASKNIGRIKRTDGDIKIEIGYNIKFNKVIINTISTDYHIEQIDTKTLKISNVSGDFSITRVNADSVDLSTVSGDISIKRIVTQSFVSSLVSGDLDIGYLDCDSANISTVSGDACIKGKINKRNCSSISGTISITEYNKEL